MMDILRTNILKLNRVNTTRDATESIKYHSQSEESVGGLSLEAHCSHNEMSMFII